MVKNEYNFQLVRGIVFLSFFSYLCERLLVKKSKFYEHFFTVFDDLVDP